MVRSVRPDQIRRILALAEQLGPDVVEQARIDFPTLTVEVARFYIDTLSEELREVRAH